MSEALMRAGLWLVAIVVVVFGLYHFMHSGAPTVGEVEPALRSYFASQCNGDSEVSQLDSIRVGEYSQPLGGWPVYANHVETCATSNGNGTMRSTYDGSHDGDRNVAVAMVRRTATGRVEIFTPGYVQAAGRQMQQMMDHALDGARTN
jgi:hypothetical protein